MKIYIEYETHNPQGRESYIHSDDLENIQKTFIPGAKIFDMLAEIRDTTGAKLPGGIHNNILWAMAKAYDLGGIHGKRMERMKGSAGK